MRKILIFTTGLLITFLFVVFPTIVSYQNNTGQLGFSKNIAHAVPVKDEAGYWVDSETGQMLNQNPAVPYSDSAGGVNPPRTVGGINPAQPPKIENPLNPKYGTVCTVLGAIIDLVVKVGSLIAALLIIWSGFLFIKAQGNPGKLTEAKKAFLWTLVGTAVLLGSSVITKIIVKTVLNVTTQAGGTAGDTQICNI